jgi:hypothetical protein
MFIIIKNGVKEMKKFYRIWIELIRVCEWERIQRSWKERTLWRNGSYMWVGANSFGIYVFQFFIIQSFDAHNLAYRSFAIFAEQSVFQFL